MNEDKKTLTPLWTKNFIIIIIINLLIFFGFQMLLPTLPLFAKNLGADESTIGLVTGIFTVSAILIRPISGILLDKVGRKIIFLIGLLIFIVSVLSYNFISSLALVLLFRFIHGFGWGAASTASNTMASDNIPKERFGEGMGYFSLASSLAMAIGPALGLFITVNYNYQVLFYTSALMVIASFLMSLSFKDKKIEVEIKKEKTKTALVLIEKTSIAPSVIMFFLTITYGTIVSFLSIYAHEQGIGNIGLFFTIYAISLLITRPIFGKIIDRFGLDYAIIPGIVLILIAMILLSFATTMSAFLLIAVIYGIGFGASQSSLQTMAIIDSAPDKRGAANATFFTGFDSGIGVGSIVYGYLASNLGYSKMYLLTIIPVIMAFILYLVKREKQEKKALQ